MAAAIFDPGLDPVEHARVLNAAGAAHRALGDRVKAARLFEEAAGLLADRDRDDERAAALNNLGLVRTEMGEPAAAVEACDLAAELFDPGSAEGRRGTVAALHTRGMAHAAIGGDEGLAAALDDYRQAQALVDDEAPYHYGLIRHSVGIVQSAMAQLRPQDRAQLLADAVVAFSEALTVFTRSAFPYQYALAKNNLGQALAGLGTDAGEGGLPDLRWALACFEDAIGVLDPRLHVAEWRQAYANLQRVEGQLAALTPGMTRADHFAALLAGCSTEDRTSLVRERLTRLLVLPEPQRHSALTELALASARLGYEPALGVAMAELAVLMELPPEGLDAGLRARFEAHSRMPDDAREEADRALDQAIGDALGGPQRIVVRDFLYSMGWERP